MAQGPLMTGLAHLQAWLADDMEELDVAIRSSYGITKTGVLKSKVGQAAQYIMHLPGKRIRPLCVLLGARVGGRMLDQTVKDMAAVVEMVHAATLLHDDVLDEGTSRRGAPAARLVFGNPASVLGGDLLLLNAMRIVERSDDRRLLEHLIDTMEEMICAESIQLDLRGTFDTDREAYLQVIQGKTAGLFRWAFTAGGTVGGMSDEEIVTLGNIGNAIGLGFQLMDDLLDLSGDATLLGKEPLADLRDGKLTWPYIIAAERDPNVLELVKNFVSMSEDGREVSATPVIQSLKATGALRDTQIFAEEQGKNARAWLMSLPASQARDAIEIVINAAINRNT